MDVSWFSKKTWAAEHNITRCFLYSCHQLTATPCVVYILNKFRKILSQSNHVFFSFSEGQVEHLDPLVKHFSPPIKSSSNINKSEISSTASTTDFAKVFYNARPLKGPLQESPFSIERDVTSRQGRQLLELLSLDRHFLLQKAEKLHLTPGPTAASMGKRLDLAALQTIENLNIDMARLRDLAHLVHYVYTPILFLPKWRYEAHSTRMRLKSDMISDEVVSLPSAVHSGKF